MSHFRYRTLIVDDEPLALNRLERLLKRFEPIIEIIDKAVNGREAIDKINNLKPDLIFLDIQMPELSGFDVLEKINHDPLIIFCTAFDQYALKAFETNSIDYLLKPIEEKRLDDSITKLKRLTDSNDKTLKQNIKDLLSDLKNSNIKRIQVKTGDKYKIINLEEIYYFKADEKYIEVHTYDTKHLINESLTTLSDKLPDDFVRIHRSAIINLNHMEEIIRLGNNLFEVRMKNSDKSRLQVSRKLKKNLDL